jgi:hypothetical protein
MNLHSFYCFFFFYIKDSTLIISYLLQSLFNINDTIENWKLKVPEDYP